MAGGATVEHHPSRSPQRTGERRLVLCAQAVGYGPAAKLLAIAERLRAHHADCLFLGSGIAFELVSRSPDVIEAVEAKPGDARARRVIASARAVVSVMDVEFARLALDLCKPLFAVDSLSWMRRPVPAEFLAARRYWVQNFPGVREHLAAIGPAPSVVGPIVPARERERPSAPSGVVVNLGGCDTPYVVAGDDAGYSDFVVRGLIDSELTSASSREIFVMAGARCIERLRARYGASGVHFVSLPYGEALALRARATLVLTAPGVTTTLECFRSGTPTFFLPPQNYSQWLVLERLCGAGLAPHAFRWADHLEPGAFVEAWTPAERVSMVRRAIRSVAGDAAAGRAYREKLACVARAPTGSLARAQRAFFDTLGPNGAATIAAALWENELQGGEWTASA